MGRKRKFTNMDLPDTFDRNCDSDSEPKSPKPIQRCAANARERARMRVLSKAFSKLKKHLPWVPPDTKLSKLDTLRLATSYIAHLIQMLQVDDDELPDGAVPGLTHPLNLVNIKIKKDTEFEKEFILKCTQF